MNSRRHFLALAAVAAAAVPALAAPVAAEANVPCYKGLPGPAGGPAWQIQQDGSQDGTYNFESGTNFAEGHGALEVNDEAYPMIPNGENACFTTETSILYPQREVGGLLVRRRVNSVGGRIRRLDTLTNTSDDHLLTKVEFAIEVHGSQISINSESGDSVVTTADSWSVHQNDGGSSPFLQWGLVGEGWTPEVVSDGDEPNAWKHKAGSMPDATLRYFDLSIPAHTTVRLLHMSGTTGSVADSASAARDRLTPFSGISQHDASTIVNWGQDPDGDGVNRVDDECPGMKGNNAKGCFTLAAQPAGGDDEQKPTPPAGDPPAGGTPSPGAQPGLPVADVTPPVVTIANLGTRARRLRITGKGIAPRIACDEACSIKVAVKVRKRGRAKRTTVLTKKAGLSSAPRTVRLKLKKRNLRRLATRTIKVVITATDAAGNRRSLTRKVRIGR